MLVFVVGKICYILLLLLLLFVVFVKFDLFRVGCWLFGVWVLGWVFLRLVVGWLWLLLVFGMGGFVGCVVVLLVFRLSVCWCVFFM